MLALNVLTELYTEAAAFLIGQNAHAQPATIYHDENWVYKIDYSRDKFSKMNEITRKTVIVFYAKAKVVS